MFRTTGVQLRWYPVGVQAVFPSGPLLLPTQYNHLAASNYLPRSPPINGPLHSVESMPHFLIGSLPSEPPRMSPSTSMSWVQNSVLPPPSEMNEPELGAGNDNEEYKGSKPHIFATALSRRPFRVSPDIFTHNPLLRQFTEQLLNESWCINGAQERQIREEEARLRIGPVGKSIFLAYARSILEGSTRNRWVCLICEASNGATDQILHRYSREGRILTHIRHHFEHRPWVCGGQCGRTQW